MIQRYKVCKYFDDHLDRTIQKGLTLIEAQKLKESLRAGVYISYEIKEDNDNY